MNHILLIEVALLMAVKGAEIEFCEECQPADTCEKGSTCKQIYSTVSVAACIPDAEEEAKKCHSSGMLMRPTLMMALFVVAVCIGLN